jgi:ornithine carbamoyltransferase
LDEIKDFKLKNGILAKKDLLTLKDYSGEEILFLLKLTGKIKKDRGLLSDFLKGRNIALLFDKQSTRTRLSFEAGISRMGGNCIYLDSGSLQIKRGETIEDSAKVMDRYLDGLIIRTFEQETVEIFAKNCKFPVINGLTDKYHPCQIMADLFTLSEQGILDKSLKFSYVGDCNNVANSLLIGFSKLGIEISIGCSPVYEPSKEILEYVFTETKKSGGKITLAYDPYESVKDADVIYTDVWVSMGEAHSDEKINELQKFQVNKKLLSFARPGVKVMHCLPAHRELEITSDVLDSASSIVWQQAENRMHAQKAILAYLFTGA